MDVKGKKHASANTVNGGRIIGQQQRNKANIKRRTWVCSPPRTRSGVAAAARGSQRGGARLWTSGSGSPSKEQSPNRKGRRGKSAANTTPDAAAVVATTPPRTGRRTPKRKDQALKRRRRPHKATSVAITALNAHASTRK